MRSVCAQTNPRSDATPTRPGNPGLGLAPQGRAWQPPAVCHQPEPRASPATPRAHEILVCLSCRGGVDLGGETPVPDTAPLLPPPPFPRVPTGQGKPDHRTAAEAAKETFSPEQPGSSALRQRSLRAPSLLFSKQAPRLSRDVRLLGDWARVPHMEAPLLEPLGLECSAALTQPDSPLGGLCPSLPEPPPLAFPAVGFCLELILNSPARVRRLSCSWLCRGLTCKFHKENRHACLV